MKHVANEYLLLAVRNTMVSTFLTTMRDSIHTQGSGVVDHYCLLAVTLGPSY